MSRYLVRVFKVGELLLSEKQYHDLMMCFAQHERVGYRDGASRCETAEIVEVGEPMKPNDEPLRHGIDCHKAPHTSGKRGYLHDESSNAPYDVDGVLYCGRCHGWMENPVRGTPATLREGSPK